MSIINGKNLAAIKITQDVLGVFKWTVIYRRGYKCNTYGIYNNIKSHFSIGIQTEKATGYKNSTNCHAADKSRKMSTAVWPAENSVTIKSNMATPNVDFYVTFSKKTVFKTSVTGADLLIFKLIYVLI